VCSRVRSSAFRMLRSLRSDRLIDIRSRCVTILDFDAPSEAAHAAVQWRAFIRQAPNGNQDGSALVPVTPSFSIFSPTGDFVDCSV
jgi:hypothetical protein